MGDKAQSHTPRKRGPSHSRLRTAIHEAAHAVIGRVVKQVCGGASIVANLDENEAGHAICASQWVTYEHWLDVLGRFRGDEMRSIMRGRIMTYMAGAEAELEFFGNCRGGDSYDRRQIDLMLDSMLPADADVPRYAARLRAFTRGLVKRHRVAIERVAQALLERSTLRSDEIDATVARWAKPAA